MHEFEIMGRRYGGDQPCFVIAEVGVNHNGDIELAHRLIDEAADAGADAVKFQTFQAEAVVSNDAPLAAYQREAMGSAYSQRDLLRSLELGYDEHSGLKQHAEERGLCFLSTPFDLESANFLFELGLEAFKLSSGDITNIPLLRRVASFHKPLLVSSGMSTLTEVEAAVAVMRKSGASSFVLLHCTSNYPTAMEDVNLRGMTTLAAAFECPVGYSDHTQGIEVSVAAVAIGASLIEKHFTLDRSLAGPDHRASLEPQELAKMVRSIRNVHAALGGGEKTPRPSEQDTRRAARRSLHLVRNVARGEKLAAGDLIALRPGDGISPLHWDRVIGKTTRISLLSGQCLSWSDIGEKGCDDAIALKTLKS
jgi:N,N'-diacetyllegionaminate synthase